MNFGIIGAQRDLALPLVDANFHGGAPTIVTGPSDRRHPLRWYVTLPTQEDAERLPAPLGHDRNSVKFDPVLLYLDRILPPSTTAVFHTMRCGGKDFPIERTCMHRWTPQPETIHWPAFPLQGTQMGPGETLELSGHGYWMKPSRHKNHRREAIYDPGESRFPPEFTTNHVVSVLCLFRISWLPAQKKRVFVVGNTLGGNPFSPEPPQST